MSRHGQNRQKAAVKGSPLSVAPFLSGCLTEAAPLSTVTSGEFAPPSCFFCASRADLTAGREAARRARAPQIPPGFGRNRWEAAGWENWATMLNHKAWGGF